MNTPEPDSTSQSGSGATMTTTKNRRRDTRAVRTKNQLARTSLRRGRRRRSNDDYYET